MTIMGIVLPPVGVIVINAIRVRIYNTNKQILTQ